MLPRRSASNLRVCGRPRRRKRFLWSARQIRSGAVVCPASRCGTSHAAGPHGDARTGSKSLKRARKLSAQSWFSRSRLVDRLPLPVLRPARIADGYPRFATLSGGFERGSPVDLLLRHDGSRRSAAVHHLCPSGPSRLGGTDTEGWSDYSTRWTEWPVTRSGLLTFPRQVAQRGSDSATTVTLWFEKFVEPFEKLRVVTHP